MLTVMQVARPRLGQFVLACTLLVGCGGAQSAPARSALAVGATAPDFDTDTHDGQRIRLRELNGHPVVLYFYPKDDTPGCTKEACAFRDAWKRFSAVGALIYGVSRDSRESHQAFVREHQLPFPLLVDETGSIAQAYGVSSFLGMNSRVTYLIDGSGRISRVFRDVDPAVHAEEVLAAIAQLPEPKLTP